MRREFRVAKTLAVVTIVFIACIIPFTVVYSITHFTNLTYLQVTRLHVTIWIVFINSTINPILYGLLNRDFPIILFIIIFTTILGNLLVITAIKTTPKLQIRPNFLILSLSITDLSVGMFAMPLMAYYNVVGIDEWTMGSVMCDIKTFISICFTTTSYLHIMFIAIDRYLSVTRIEYSRNKSKSHVMAMIEID
ncbi:unnamed protein product [Oppiella nova]|uniref:G-protein coupled receptors family 1 profile domain-containing protein n=1 Tax=Oppiella nova TaxID=334625 RepID=A0A7R9LGL6_9ACAR|nr:unnamed protein product [Oppiella nova]CAG2163393.1 unnamed protein product [Oppiella nova]